MDLLIHAIKQIILHICRRLLISSVKDVMLYIMLFFLSVSLCLLAISCKND